MKHPILKLKKKTKLKGIRKIKNEIRGVVHACLLDIEDYIVSDLMNYLKKIGVIYAEKKAKNTKTKKSKK